MTSCQIAAVPGWPGSYVGVIFCGTVRMERHKFGEMFGL